MLIAQKPVKMYTLQLATTNLLHTCFNINANNVQIDKTKPLWHNYFLCEFKGIQDYFGLSNRNWNEMLGGHNHPSQSWPLQFQCFGMWCWLGDAHSLGMNPSKVNLAEICAKGECYIGTEGGEMNQPI